MVISGGPGAGDGQVPVAAREIQRSEKQEKGCPSVDAVGQADEARGGRDAAAGDTRDSEGADVTVLHGLIRCCRPARGGVIHHLRRRSAMVVPLGAFMRMSPCGCGAGGPITHNMISL